MIASFYSINNVNGDFTCNNDNYHQQVSSKRDFMFSCFSDCDFGILSKL